MVKKIVKYKEVSIASLLSFLLVAGGSIWAYAALHSISNGPLIVHFDDLSGITAVGSIARLLVISILGVVVTVMNFFIAIELEERDGFLGKIIAGITLILSILLFLALSAIIRVN